jgi:hypothetical protein
MSDTWDAFPDAPPARTGGTQTIPGQNGAPSRVIMDMGSKGDSWDQFPDAPPTDYGGLAKAGGIGVAKGAIGLAGLPGDAAALLKKGADWVSDKLPEIPTNQLAQFLAQGKRKYASTRASGDLPGSYELPTSENIQGTMLRK